MNRAAGAELGRHGLPLATGAQHVANSGHYVSQRQSWTTTVTTRFVIWEQRFNPLPQRIGNLVKL